VREGKDKVAFCFPGQLQERPRSEDFSAWKDHPRLLETLDRASRYSGFRLTDFQSDGDTGGDQESLNLQLATYLLSMFQFFRLRDAGWVPTVIAEHSMGVYAALAASEAISFEDGLVLTESIGKLLQEEGHRRQGAMASIIGLSLDAVQKICRDLDAYELFIANYNGPLHYVLSGEAEGVAKAVDFALSRKAISATRLAFRTALHTPALLSLRERVLNVVREMKVDPPKIPVISHWSIKPVKKEEIKEFLSQEIGRPVYWVRCVEKLVQDGVTRFIEVGQGTTLVKLIRGINREVETLSSEDCLSRFSPDPVTPAGGVNERVGGP
jgi:[acyl-carrier-protein] S-malonyltransferase